MSDRSEPVRVGKLSRARVLGRWFGENEVVMCHWCPRRLNQRGTQETNANYCTVDHLKEKALGGTDDYANLVPACAGCNSSRSSGLKLKPYRLERLNHLDYGR